MPAFGKRPMPGARKKTTPAKGGGLASVFGGISGALMGKKKKQPALGGAGGGFISKFKKRGGSLAKPAGGYK